MVPPITVTAAATIRTITIGLVFTSSSDEAAPDCGVGRVPMGSQEGVVAGVDASGCCSFSPQSVQILLYGS